MAKTYKPTLVDSVLGAAALAKHRFVTQAGAYAAAGVKAYGVTETEIDTGEYGPVDIHGILLVESGAAITAWSEVEVGTDGKAITKSTGISNGMNIDAANGTGEIIRIIRPI